VFENQPTRRGASQPAAVQRRGIERVQAILDAAESLLAEQGYAAATLKAVGERAGIPTASLYHYFADRRQVDAQLVRRHLDTLDEELAGALNDTTVRTLVDSVDTTISLLLNYFRDHPSFVQLWFAGRSASLSELAHEFDQSWAEQLWRFLVDRKLIRTNTPQFTVELAFEAGDRLFDIAFQRSLGGDDAVIAEARRLITAYLQTYAPVPKRAAKKAGAKWHQWMMTPLMFLPSRRSW
jgi:AcrR family transcriptional regulator